MRALWLDETTLDREAAARPANAVDRVRRALPTDGSARGVRDLADAAGITYGSAGNALTQLRAAGEAETPERGQWRRLEGGDAGE